MMPGVPVASWLCAGMGRGGVATKKIGGNSV